MPLIRFLYVTNFVTGSIVMIIELLGTRFLSPYFGASLYVWTALITVALVALALGYALGGQLADRFPNASTLYGLIFAAGASLMAILLVRKPILAAGSASGIVAGTLVSAAILFGPPLLILGTVAPFSVKLCARELSALGSTVGRLYALSTAGSFVGTLAAGFVLLPAFSNVATLVFSSAVLAAISGAYFLAFKRTSLPAAGAAVMLGIAALVARDSHSLRSGTLAVYEQEFTTIFQANSFYGRIHVVDTKDIGDAEWKWRTLLNDGLIQGQYDLKEKQAYATFPYALSDLVLSPGRTPERVLLLGLGAGFIPRILREHGVSEVVTVEINPLMLEVARRFFDLHDDPACPVIFEDARTWVTRCDRRFDAVIVDTFLGDNAPSHLLSLEMFQGLRRVLEDDGVVAMNIFGSMRDKGARLIAAIVRTLREVPFPHVQVFCLEATSTAHNVYLLAAPRPREKRPKGIQRVFPYKGLHRRVQFALKDQTAELDGIEEAPILLDDSNAAEHLDVAVRMWMRKHIREFWREALPE